MRACWREGVVPLLQMHDSLDLSVTSPEVAEIVARLGEEVIKLEVPMKVDIKYGRTWGDAKHTWEALHGPAEPPWEETPLAAASVTTKSPSEPPHICIHCHPGSAGWVRARERL